METVLTSNEAFYTSSSKYEEFERGARELVNRLGLERGSHTPDIVLAKYLRDCLITWDMAVQRREGMKLVA